MLRIQYVEFIWKLSGEWYVFDTYQLHVKALKYECNNNILIEIEKCKVSLQFLLVFRKPGDVLFFPYARRFRGYTATVSFYPVPNTLTKVTICNHLRPHMQFTCNTCSLPVKTGNYTCFYASSTSRRVRAMALDKARKLQVTSPAWCRLTYLQFAGEFTRGVIADCLQLQVILRGIASFFACDWRVFLPALLVFLSVSCMYFCLQKQAILHASCGQICRSSACKTNCKMPVVFR